MYKLISLIISLMLILCACGNEPAAPSEPEISEPSREWSEAAPEEPEVNEEFYPISGAYVWNKDGSITFKSGAELVTLSPENEIVKSVSLPGAEAAEYFWSGEYILALDKSEDGFFDGRVTALGEDIGFVNAALYSAEGELLHTYPKAELFYEDEGFDMQAEIDGEWVKCVELKDPLWISESEAVFSAAYNLVCYDFKALAGEIIFKGRGEMLESLDSKSTLPEAAGICKGKLIFNVDYSTAAPFQGNEPPADYTEEEWNIQTGADYTWETRTEVWAWDGEKAEKLFDGEVYSCSEDFFVFGYEGEFYYANGEDGEAALIHSENYSDIFSKISHSGIQISGTKILFRPNITAEEREFAFCYYDTATGKAEVFQTQHTVYSQIEEFFEAEGKLYYFFMADATTTAELGSSYWVYDTETGFSKNIYENKASFTTPAVTLSPGLDLIAQTNCVDNQDVIRVAKFEYK